VVRHRLLIAITWVAVTASAVGIAWLAVSNAVANVADPLPTMISGPSAAAPPVSPSSTAPGITSGTDALSVAPDDAASRSAGGSGLVPDTTVQGPTGIADPVSVQSDDSGAPPTTAGPSTQSFSKTGGVVTMRCDGNAASLVSATPAQGYTVRVSDAGPEQIEVAFTSPSHDSEFHGLCVNGQPAAQVTDD